MTCESQHKIMWDLIVLLEHWWSRKDEWSASYCQLKYGFLKKIVDLLAYGEMQVLSTEASTLSSYDA